MLPCFLGPSGIFKSRARKRRGRGHPNDDYPEGNAYCARGEAPPSAVTRDATKRRKFWTSQPASGPKPADIRKDLPLSGLGSRYT
jgi:hypothetical protein